MKRFHEIYRKNYSKDIFDPTSISIEIKYFIFTNILYIRYDRII